MTATGAISRFEGNLESLRAALPHKRISYRFGSHQIYIGNCHKDLVLNLITMASFVEIS
jgi:hypothetical protein